jgi:hypothetical protein
VDQLITIDPRNEAALELKNQILTVTGQLPFVDLLPKWVRDPKLWIGLAAVVILAVALTIFWPDAGPVAPVVAESQMALNVSPWANVESIQSLDNNQEEQLSRQMVTPCVVSLPPGRYLIRVQNPFYETPMEFEVDLQAGQTHEVFKQLPGVDLESEIDNLLEGF